MRALSRTFSLTIVLLAVASGTPSVYAQCSWFAPPAPIAFGNYSVFGGASNTTSTSGTVRCTGTVTFRVTASTGGSGTYNPRRMNGVANYNVYTNAGRTTIWGDGTGGTGIFTWFNFGGTNNYSGFAYGTVFGGQDLAPGSYSDTIIATLSWRPGIGGGGGGWTTLPGVAIPVSMTVPSECRINTFSLSFGNYNPFNAGPVNQSTVVNVYCTRTTPATFALDNGANPLGAQKRMRSGVDYLNYTATLASNSGVSTSSLVPIGNGITLNGSIPASQDAPVGNFVDTLQVIVNY